MSMLFSPTIGAAVTARYWFLWVRCPALPYHERDRLAHARPSPRRGRDQPHSRTVMPLMPAERAVRRARAAIANKHRGRNGDRAHAAGARRVSDGPRRREAVRPSGLGYYGLRLGLPGLLISDFNSRLVVELL
jgi:hypothetical protein